MSSTLAAVATAAATAAVSGSDSAAAAAAPAAIPANLNHSNKGPHLMVSVWVLCGLSAIFLSLRIYCKFLGRRGLWWDDHMLLASWVMVLANCICITYMVHLGYGKHVWDFNIANLNSYVLAANIRTVFTVCAAAWSKTSFCLTLMKISGKRTTYLLYAIIATMNILLGLSALFPWVQCNPIQKGWKPLIEGTCWPGHTLIHYDMAAGAWSAAMDILLVIVPWKVVLGLQMHLREKLGVAIAMSMGLFAGITACIKVAQLKNLAASDFQKSVDLVIWDTAESASTIMAASIPLLRVLVRQAASSARNYYNSNSRGYAKNTSSTAPESSVVASGGPTARAYQGQNHSNYVAQIIHGTAPGSANGSEDDRSDRSILEGQRPVDRNVYVTEEINVKYGPSGDVESGPAQSASAYEMQDMTGKAL